MPAMRPAELREFLRERPRVGDGAVGTALYLSGVPSHRSFDNLNRSEPDRVRAVHAAHLAAGAELISTNTFGANRIKLERHGLGAAVAAINRAGAEVARTASGSPRVVLGAVGPTGKTPDPFDEAASGPIRSAFVEQIAALAPGVDALLLETFTNLGEALLALSAAREVAPELGTIVVMTFTEDGRTRLGTPASRVAMRLAAAGADAVGSNCGVGPATTLTALEAMRPAVDVPLVAQPNAGIPDRVEGRFLYPSSPDYVAHYARRYLRLGVSLIGGCCGTAGEHVAAIAGVVRAASAGSRTRSAVIPPTASSASGSAVEAEAPAAPRSRLARTLAAGEFAVSVELDPPWGGSPRALLRRARKMADAGVQFVNVADGPRASARMSAIAFAALLERDGAVESILHYQCRDRNLIGIQADLLGAHALGIGNVLAVTGDPPKLGDYPHATAVFDMDSVGLIRLVTNLRRGLDLAGNRLAGALPFCVGAGVNPAAPDLDREIAHLERKVASGAAYAMTQPIYDQRLLDAFLGRIAAFRVPVLVGVLPLVSHRNAEFLHNEVPGMTVPRGVRTRLAGARTKKAARAVGVSVARDMVRAARDLAEGVYVMPPFNRVGLALRTVRGLV